MADFDTILAPGPDGVWTLVRPGDRAPQPKKQDEKPAEAPADSEVEEDLIGAEAADTAVEKPSFTGSRADWEAYALATGATEEDVEGKSRNELRATYGG